MTKNANCLLCVHNINLVCEERIHQKNKGSKPIFDDCDFFIKDRNKWI